MAIIETVKKDEQWVVALNGDYGICFREAVLAADAVDGEIIDTPVVGIVSGGGVSGETVRVMVRGNPSKVDGSQLTGDASSLDASIIVL